NAKPLSASIKIWRCLAATGAADLSLDFCIMLKPHQIDVQNYIKILIHPYVPKIMVEIQEIQISFS
ncbi:MAG: hypothetical protein K2K95_08945, partial [Muribaculaceae bacterium]|nr:hypothetical protein [Muribaculaceae bacterium]